MNAQSAGRFKVMMTADAVGGVFSYALSLARELCGSGGSVVLALMGPRPSDEQRKLLRAVPNLTWHESDFALEWADQPWRSVDAAGEWLLDLAHRSAPDVVHLNGYCHAALPWPCKTLVVAHSCVTSWWRAVHGDDPPQAYDEYRDRVRIGLEQAHLVVAPTAAMLGDLRAAYEFSSPSMVISNGADTSELTPGLKLDYFLCAGRAWDQAKNVEAVEQASHELTWPVFIAGEAPGWLGASPNIRSLGRVSPQGTRALMQGAAVLLHPARYEPFGLAPLEAALCGCALILGDIPSLREVWGDAALYVSPDDSAELARVAAMLARSNRLRRDFALKALARAHRYSIRRTAASYADAYCDLVHGQSFRSVGATAFAAPEPSRVAS